MTQQGDRQASIRAITGTSLPVNGDWHALFDQAGITEGAFDGRMLTWINLKLGSAYTSLPAAQQALAAANSAPSFSALGAFDASLAPSAPVFIADPAISGAPTQGQTLSATTGACTGSPAPTFTGQWNRDGVAISSATATTYTPTSADRGHVLTYTSTASNSQGSASRTSAGVTIAAPLSISGTPSTSVTVSSAYDFLPSAAGGHTPYNFAVSNKPAWASFNTSTGELSGTAPAAGETDSNIAIGVTDANGLTQTLAPWTLTVSAITYKNAHYDDFSGAAVGSNLGGRALTTGGLSWAFDNGGTSNSTSLQVDGSGRLKFDGGTSPRDTAATITPASVKPNRIIRQRLSVAAGDAAAPSVTTQILFSLNKIGTSNYSGVHLTWVPAGGTGTTAINAATAGGIHGGTVTFNAGIGGTAVGRNGGDVLTHIKYPGASGQVYIDTYLNGRKVTDGSSKDLSAAIPTWNDVLGIQGGDGTVGGGTPGYATILDDIMIADPASEFVVQVYRPGKTLDRKIWNDWLGTGNPNDVRVPVAFDYTLADPASSDITVTLYSVDGAGGETAMTGYVDLPLSNFQIVTPIGSNLWGRAKGEVTIAAADAPETAQFTFRVKRTLTAYSLAPAYGWSPILRAGRNIMSSGQSITTEGWQTISIAVSYTDPPGGWQIDGSTDPGSTTPTAAISRRVVPSTAAVSSPSLQAHASPQGYLMATLAALGLQNNSYIRAGYGGTTMQQRNPVDGSATQGDASKGAFAAAQDGADMAGDFSVLVDNSVTFEVDKGDGWPGAATNITTAINLFQAAILKQVAAWEAYLGHPILVILSGAASTETLGQDLKCQALYRAKWAMCQPSTQGAIFAANGYTGQSKFVYSGSDGYDLNRKDNYHEDNSSYGFPEMFRRYAYAIAAAVGATPHDRMGPNAMGVASWTANSVTVQIDRRGADSLALSNGAATSGTFGLVNTTQDPHCGFAFTAGDGTFASGNQLTPSAMPTFADNGDGTTNVTWTFSGTPFSAGAKPCVRPPFGSSPSVPVPYSTNYRAYISQTYSMIVGVYGSENVVPVQRYYSLAFNANPGTDYLAGA